ncbi:MAG: hypothetical protein ACI8P0_003114 [Planctomycetaceae bacterium]|jgi:hypothetical protein
MFPLRPPTSTSIPSVSGRAKTRLVADGRPVLVLAMAAVVVFQLMAPERVAAQDAGANVVVPESECKVKYVYLYSFGLLTKWPDETFERTDNAFVIGVLGDKPYGGILDAIAKRKKIDKRRIVVRRFKTIEEYRPCHILYVTESIAEEDARAVKLKLKDDAVLIVGETPGFEYFGGVISFRIEDENVKFSLNVDAVKRRHLMVSARLSRLASLVRDTDRRQPVSTVENR